MSDIVLTASVRQNLLSLQSTADLLATTQNRLATGKKVNTALDNPTNFFTAQGLDNRASDINNLLDSIGNGVQVLQAANTGITSLQKLVDTAKSIANQVLQAPAGYSAKVDGYFGGRPLGSAPRPILVDGANQSKPVRPSLSPRNGALPAAHRPPLSAPAKLTRSKIERRVGARKQNLTASLDSSNKLVFIHGPTTFASFDTIGAVTVVLGFPVLLATFGAASAPRCSMPPRRPFVLIWSASTTTSSRRSPPLRRTCPSMASIC